VNLVEQDSNGRDDEEARDQPKLHGAHLASAIVGA
jgi:hypothetical protein